MHPWMNANDFAENDSKCTSMHTNALGHKSHAFRAQITLIPTLPRHPHDHRADGQRGETPAWVHELSPSPSHNHRCVLRFNTHTHCVGDPVGRVC